MSKTLGQIAKDEFVRSLVIEGEILPTSKTWDAVAKAVAERCAQVADDQASKWRKLHLLKDARLLESLAKDIRSLINGGEDA